MDRKILFVSKWPAAKNKLRQDEGHAKQALSRKYNL